MFVYPKIIDIKNGKYFIEGSFLPGSTARDFIKQLEEKASKGILFAKLEENPAAVVKDIIIKKDGIYAKMKTLETSHGKKLMGIMEGQNTYNQPHGYDHIGVASRNIGSLEDYITHPVLRTMNWFWITRWARKRWVWLNGLMVKYTIKQIIDPIVLGYDIVSNLANPNTRLVEKG